MEMEAEVEKVQILINKLTELGIPFLIDLISAIVIFVVGKWLSKRIATLVAKLMEKSNVDPAITGFVKNIVSVAILVFAIVAAIGKLGIETTSFIAILGAAGLAVGMALQGTLSNFASGVMLILFRPFKVGDFIDGGGTLGTVKSIQIFHTILATPDNRKIILPNSKIAGDVITNFTDTDQRRIDMIFGISYDDNIENAKKILMGLVEADERILKDPAPVIAVTALGDSSVNIKCRPWVKPSDYWNVHDELLEKGKAALEAGGCTIPYPQRDVHLYENKNS